MFRGIASVIVGALVAFLLMFTLLSVASVALGVDRTLEPGSYHVTPLWMGIMVAACIVGSLSGGAACRWIAKAKRPVHALAVVFFLLSMVSSLGEMTRPDPGPRSNTESRVDSAMKAKEPAFILILIPVLGYVTILIGGGFRKEPPLPNPKVA